MSRKFSTILLLAAFFAANEAAAGAEIRVMSAVPLAPGVTQVADQFKRSSGHDVVVQSVTTGDINRILSSNEPFDILITTTALVDQAAKDGKATAATRAMAGRVGVGVLVRSAGGAAPNISSADALKQAVLAADALVYNTAGSGQYVHSMLEKLGVSAQVQAKVARPANAAQTMDRILQGKGNEIGFGLISEIKPYEAKGVRFVGPLPAALQNYTNYEAIIANASKVADPAREFIGFLTTSSSKSILARTGVD